MILRNIIFWSLFLVSCILLGWYFLRRPDFQDNGQQKKNIQPISDKNTAPQKKPVAIPEQPPSPSPANSRPNKDMMPTDDSYITRALFAKDCPSKNPEMNLVTVKSLDDLLGKIKEKGNYFSKDITFENQTFFQGGKYKIYNIVPDDSTNKKTFTVKIFVKDVFDSPATLDESLPPSKLTEISNEQLHSLLGESSPLKHEKVFRLSDDSGNKISLVTVQDHVKFIESSHFSCNGLSGDQAECRCF